MGPRSGFSTFHGAGEPRRFRATAAGSGEGGHLIFRSWVWVGTIVPKNLFWGLSQAGRKILFFEDFGKASKMPEFGLNWAEI